MTCNLFKGRDQSSAEQDLRLEVVLPLLCRRCQDLCAERDAPGRYADEKGKVVREVKSILQTLGSGLLEHITIAFLNAYREHESHTRATRQASNIDYDRWLNTPSIVQRIGALQAKLDVTKDGDEQRALEEDVTGKARAVSSCYIPMLTTVYSLIDPVALLVWDLRRSRRTVTKGCELHSERRRDEGFTGGVRGYEAHDRCGP
ncbi:hypothetical protein EDC04DRAFT_1845993 [Pisolithus marmoratus]|nr:hypothetical protein EDC04DRAFT_1845993 [Pisolithus marmoratus]